MTIKNFRSLFLLTGVLLVIVFAGIYIKNKVEEFSFEKEKEPFPILYKKDTTLTIGLIGDSWVAGKKLDSIIKGVINNNGISCKIISSGQFGATSKNVYQNLFKNIDDDFSSKQVLQSHPDYCCIFAGINDIGGRLGAAFYSHHLLLIIKLLKYYNVVPVIITIPEMEINTGMKMSVVKKIKRSCRDFFTHSEYINHVEDYKLAFRNDLNRSGYRDSVLLINLVYEENQKDYVNYSDLAIRPFHLTYEGNKILSNKIVSEILDDYQKRNKISAL